jgi:outer membrane protein assembly factor BamB
MRQIAPLLLIATLVTGPAASEDWPAWGGPRRDFSVIDPGLSAEWPRDGLDVLWDRPLGEGYSGIAVVDDRLYTMFSEGDEEVIIALEASSGAPHWQHRYSISPWDGMRLGYGKGPHATPTIADGRVFAVGTTAVLTALEAATGRLLWQVDLWAEYGSGRLRRGYGSSPFLHEGRLLMPLGGDGGIVALDPATGELLWQQPGFASAQSSPVVAELGGQELLILFAQDEVVGLRPADGGLLWRLPHESLGPYNISTPVLGPDDLLFVSSSYGGGAQGIRLQADSGTVRAESLWRSNRLSIHFTNAIRIADHVYGSSGRGTAVTTALDMRTGELAWRTREISRANFLRVGDRALALEEDGRLLLLGLTPEGPQITAETRLVDRQTWTIPTLVGSTLFVRDRQRIFAVRLPLSDE